MGSFGAGSEIIQEGKEFVDAMAPTTGFAGSVEELQDQLGRIADLGTDEVVIIPTSTEIDQVHQIASVADSIG